MSESLSTVAALEESLRQKEKIIAVLMKRVETAVNLQGSDYDVFQTASVLEKEVGLKTAALNETLIELRQQQQKSENDKQFLKRVLNNIDDFVAIISPNRLISFINERPLEAAGLALDDVVGRHFWDMAWFDFPGCDKAYIEYVIEQAFLGKKTSKDIQVKFKGVLYWLSYKSTPVFDNDGNISEVVAEGFLIDDQKKAEIALTAEKERIQTTLESIGDAVIVTDKDCIIEYMNPIAEKLTGWCGNRAIGLPVQQVFFIINEATGGPAPNPSERAMKEGRIVGLANHTGLVHRDGHTISIEDSAAPIRHANGEISGSVLVFHDVSQTRRMAKELEYHANHDALTGLTNRRQFEQRLKHALTSLKKKHADFALFYMDLDQFKLVNDTCGHQAGDELLRLLTALIKPRLRERDTFARLGGDEFGILLEHCPPDKTMSIADELRQLIKDFRFSWNNQVFTLGVSIGVVNLMDVWDIEAVDPLKLADTACYAAKDAGRNYVYLYQTTDKEILQREGEMNWINRISQAIEHGLFELHAQIIAPLQKDTLPSVELLIRMVNKENGELIPPGAFLPSAERYGLMEKVDRWVVSNTLEFFTQSPALLEKVAYFSINLSGLSIGSEDFLRYVQSLFIQTGVPYSKIAFEVTETDAILNLEKATLFIQQMQKLGCKFLLDDFGSGMSSFTYLKQLPVDKLKIDGAFVRDIVDDEIDRAMVRSINDIGHTVGMETVAEFVENEAIVQQLMIIGVDYVQGYGVAKPEPLSGLTDDSLQKALNWVQDIVNSK